MERRSLLKSLAGIVGVATSLALTQGRAEAAATLATIDDVDRVLREGTANINTMDDPPDRGVRLDGYRLALTTYPSDHDGGYVVNRDQEGDVWTHAWFDFWYAADYQDFVMARFALAILIERAGQPAMRVWIDNPHMVVSAFHTYERTTRDDLPPAILTLAETLRQRLLALGPIQVEDWPDL